MSCRYLSAPSPTAFNPRLRPAASEPSRRHIHIKLIVIVDLCHTGDHKYAAYRDIDRVVDKVASQSLVNQPASQTLPSEQLFTATVLCRVHGCIVMRKTIW